MNPGDQTNAGEQSAGTDALLRFARDMWRYKWVVPLVVGLAGAAAYGWLQRQPRVFRASCLVEYLPNPTQPLQGEVHDAAGSSSAWWATREFYETQNKLFTSRSVAERVVRELDLDSNAEFLSVPAEEHASFGGKSVAEAASVLRSRLDVSQLRDTALVTVSVEDTDPARAQQLANAVVRAYIERSIDDRLQSSTRALEWLGSQMGDLKQDLSEAELSLYEFRKENSSLSASLDERKRLIAEKLHHYTSALTETRTRKIGMEARLTVLRQAALEAPSAASGGRLAAESATLAQLRGSYIEQREEVDGLLAKYGKAHPSVAALLAKLESLERQYALEVGSMVNRAEDELHELQLTEKGLIADLEAVNQEGLNLSLHEMEYSQLDRERQSRAELYSLVVERAAEADLTRAFQSAHARIVDEALEPSTPVSPNVRLTLFLGIFAGLMLGLMVAALLARLDNKFTTASDVESAGVTVLGVLPSIESGAATAGYMRRRQVKGRDAPSRDLVVHSQPRSSVAESCRNIRTNLAFQAADRPLHTLAITSAGPSEGKTTVSVSVATAFAQNGQRVLLVDSDLRRPRLHRALGVPPGGGLTSVLARESELDDVLTETQVPGLTLLQCGPMPPNPAELLHTRRFSELVAELKQRFDLVLFDTPPVGAVTDATIVAKLMDSTLLVVKARQTTKPALASTLRCIHDLKLPLVGAVLNDVDVTRGGYAGGYYYQYYGQNEDTPGPPNTPPAKTASA